MKNNPHRILLAAFICIATLQGCAAVVVGAGVGAASAAHDRRSLGTQVDDNTASLRLSGAINKNKALEEANINVYVFNGIALLTGQVGTEQMRQEVQNTVSSVKNLRKIHNQLRVRPTVTASETANDVWLAGKVKSALIADKRIDGLHVAVKVENAEVFLVGLVKQSEADIAVDIARNINGVAKVIKAFEYL